MKIKRIISALAGMLALILAGCAATEGTSDFGKITTTERVDFNEPDRTGNVSGVGFVHQY